MPTPKKGPRLGGSPAHQRLIVANLATALFEHGRITTTEAKARFLRPVAEKLITKAKKAHLGENAPAQPSRGPQDHPRQVGRAHALHRDRPDLRRASGWLHPDHQARPPQGRQRPHGGHRAGDRGLPAEGADRQEGRPRPRRLPRAPAAEPETEETDGRGDRPGRARPRPPASRRSPRSPRPTRRSSRRPRAGWPASTTARTSRSRTPPRRPRASRSRATRTR